MSYISKFFHPAVRLIRSIKFWVHVHIFPYDMYEYLQYNSTKIVFVTKNCHLTIGSSYAVDRQYKNNQYVSLSITKDTYKFSFSAP